MTDLGEGPSAEDEALPPSDAADADVLTFLLAWTESTSITSPFDALLSLLLLALSFDSSCPIRLSITASSNGKFTVATYMGQGW